MEDKVQLPPNLVSTVQRFFPPSEAIYASKVVNRLRGLDDKASEDYETLTEGLLHLLVEKVKPKLDLASLPIEELLAYAKILSLILAYKSEGERVETEIQRLSILSQAVQEYDLDRKFLEKALSEAEELLQG